VNASLKSPAAADRKLTQAATASGGTSSKPSPVFPPGQIAFSNKPPGLFGFRNNRFMLRLWDRETKTFKLRTADIRLNNLVL